MHAPVVVFAKRARLAAAFLLTLTVASAPQAGSAQSANDTMNVTATVNASCSITANDLDFGVYDPLAGSPDDAATTLDLRCTNGTAYSITMNAGQGAGATITVRKMTAGANTLNYSLYSDAARTAVWGETGGVNDVAGAGDGTVQSIDVYGRAPAAQNVAAGSYSDIVTVTVTY